MNCDPRELQDQPTFSFMTFVRGVVGKAMPVTYAPGALDAFGQRLDLAELRAEQRERYAWNADEEKEDETTVKDVIADAEVDTDANPLEDDDKPAEW